VTPSKTGYTAPVLPFNALLSWLRRGWISYTRTVWPSSLFAALFAVIGAAGHALLVNAGLAPIVYPWAAGFMLFGPALLCGYFEVSQRLRDGEPARLKWFWQGFRASPPALWVIGILSAFLLLVWLTDAAIIYSLYFGREPVYLHWAVLSDPGMRDTLWAYFVFSSLAGAVLALIVFAITAFAVPLLYFRRQPLTAAVGRSVRIVFANPVTLLAWGVLLSASVVGSILLFMPAFVVVFPVLAYASEAAYRQACDEPEASSTAAALAAGD